MADSIHRYELQDRCLELIRIELTKEKQSRKAKGQSSLLGSPSTPTEARSRFFMPMKSYFHSSVRTNGTIEPGLADGSTRSRTRKKIAAKQATALVGGSGLAWPAVAEESMPLRPSSAREHADASETVGDRGGSASSRPPPHGQRPCKTVCQSRSPIRTSSRGPNQGD